MENIKNKINCFGIIMILLMSNTMYFGLVKRKATFIVFIFTILISLAINKIRVKKYNIIMLFILSLSLLGSLVLNIDIVDKRYITNIIQSIVILWSVGIFIGYIERDYFINTFINIIFYFCIISLFCVFISNFIPSYAYKLYKVTNYANSQYLLSPFYMWGKGSIWLRNSGPFWEPGAFQGFINIAILFILTSRININNMNIKLVILLITLLTTQSTTGYILFMLNILCFGKDILIKYKKNSIILKILVISLFIVGIIIIFKSNNIVQKFTSTENPSTTIRRDDLVNSLELMKERPLRGIGSGEYKDKYENLKEIKNNSNGILVSGYMYGVIFLLIYICLFMIGIKHNFIEVKSIKRVFLIINFLILHLTEPLVWLPFYMVFLFRFKSENVYINKSKKLNTVV